jgi:Xaa-Pro aminopeptidase
MGHSESLIRLAALRGAMQRHGVQACLIPSADPHLSEYLPAHWQIRQWLTGFTGSVGTVVVTAEHAALWVDSRYWVQAERELAGSGFVVERIAVATDAGPLVWLANYLRAGECLAVDGRTLSVQAHQALATTLSAGVQVNLDLDLPGEVWCDRAGLPQARVTLWPDSLAGQTRAEKLSTLRGCMVECGATHHLISSLDDIAWVLNLRGSDVPFNPVFLSHLLVTSSSATLFVNPVKLDSSTVAALTDAGVLVEDYEQLRPTLLELSASDVLWVDPARTASAFVLRCPAKRVERINASTLAKSRKNGVELTHWREVMAADGAALCEFFAWLEHAIDNRHQQPLTEWMLDEAVNAARAQSADFIGPSFATIAAFNANGAMPHYRATQTQHARIEGDGLLLIDSGGQYWGGTTDITRMVPVGALSDAQRADCTLVLQAMIAMSVLQFPEGIAAPLIDAVARAPLWCQGLDYGHGTGHGVGYGLNVHEGPQVLSYKAVPNANMSLWPGMVTSNEPGLYRPGQWGVRIENLVCAELSVVNEFGRFLGFETLTLCPIDLRCIKADALDLTQRQWLNAYHERVRAALLSRVNGPALKWLLDRTEPLPL